MTTPELLEAVKEYLKDCPPCSSFEVTMLHALAILEKNGGNRTHTYKQLKIGLRTLRNWIQILLTWKIRVPESDRSTYRPKSQKGRRHHRYW